MCDRVRRGGIVDIQRATCDQREARPSCSTVVSLIFVAFCRIGEKAHEVVI